MEGLRHQVAKIAISTLTGVPTKDETVKTT